MLKIFFICTLLFYVKCEGSDAENLNENELIFKMRVLSRNQKFECENLTSYHQYFENDTVFVKFHYTPINYVNITYSTKKLLFYWHESTVIKDMLILPITNITPDKSGDWTFTVFGQKKDTYVKNALQYNSQWYATATCLTRIHIRPLKSPIRVSINKKVIETPSTKINNSELNYVDFSTIYYYTEGERVNVFCSRRNLSLYDVLLKYNDDTADKREYRDFGGVSEPGYGLALILQAEHNYTYFTCSLDLNEDKEKTTVLVRFLMNRRSEAIAIVPDVNTPTIVEKTDRTGLLNTKIVTNNQDKSNDVSTIWMFVAVGGLTCLVIVCVLASIYKLKRNSFRQLQNYENLTNESGSIPSYPAQWDNQSTMYAVPVFGNSQSTNKTCYAIPIPKSQRNKIYKKSPDQNARESPEYEELPEKYTRESPETESCGSSKDKRSLPGYTEPLYAEIPNYSNISDKGVPNINQGTLFNSQGNRQGDYNNVFNQMQYVNHNVEYVEPAYCEIENK